jgi:hypothetical protein
MSRVQRLYGAQPLHLLATVVSFAIVAAGVAGWFAPGSDPVAIIIWALGAAFVFEWILLPLVWALDRIALGPQWRRAPASPSASERPNAAPAPTANRAYMRVPALLSALLLIVFAPLIFSADRPEFETTTGIVPPDYLTRWLLATAAMFVVSAVAYALSLRRARGQRSNTQ